jgi:hypothetical protein
LRARSYRLATARAARCSDKQKHPS